MLQILDFQEVWNNIYYTQSSHNFLNLATETYKNESTYVFLLYMKRNDYMESEVTEHTFLFY